jgi:transcriptional regulator with XRE-family HTH domain
MSPRDRLRRFSPGKLRRWRLGKHLSQRQLADRTGYTEARISQMENSGHPPSKRFLSILKDKYGVDPSRFIEGALLLSSSLMWSL